MKLKDAKSKSSEDMQAPSPNEIKISSGQTNILQSNSQQNTVISKSSSQ
jgi:hypothetical protein